jgi:hypothetical protein
MRLITEVLHSSTYTPIAISCAQVLRRKRNDTCTSAIERTRTDLAALKPLFYYYYYKYPL